MNRTEAKARVAAILSPLVVLVRHRSGPKPYQILKPEYIGSMAIDQIIGKGDSWDEAIERLLANLADPSLDESSYWRNLKRIARDKAARL